jgi:hypothetical protein
VVRERGEEGRAGSAAEFGVHKVGVTRIGTALYVGFTCKQ